MWVRMLLALLCSSVIVMSTSQLFPVGDVATGAAIGDFTRHLDARIPEIMEVYEVPGVSVVLVRDGALVWSNAYGYANVANQTPLTKNARLRVQSISKSVTAWGVMKLVEQGLIELDAPVGSYLVSWDFPTTEPSNGSITVRQLLSHTAGLPLGDIFQMYAPEDHMPSLRERLSAETFFIQEPGTRFSYSNTGYHLLELLIEDVTGRDFSEYMEQEILLPLGMEHSSFQWNAVFATLIPNGYDLNGREIPIYVYPEKASGGLFATAEDIGSFLLAGMSGYAKEPTILDQSSIEQLYTASIERLGIYSMVFDAYGLGYYTELLNCGETAVSHGGQGSGWMSHFHSIPDSGDGIVLLTNSQRSWPLISYILTDWSRWTGHSPLGMSRIVTGIHILWLAVGLVLFLSLLLLMATVESLIRGQARMASLFFQPRWQRSVSFASSLSLIAILVWCVNQKYLFLTSVFPVSSIWLGASLFLLAAVMLLSAFCIQKES